MGWIVYRRNRVGRVKGWVHVGSGTLFIEHMRRDLIREL